jgi:hypothetical protein
MRTAAVKLLLSASLLLCCRAVPTNSILSESVSTAADTATKWATGLHEWMRSPWSQKLGDICTDEDWRKTSLKLVRELPIAGLFRDLKGTTRWEASGTDIVDGDKLFMVFDSLDYVGYVSTAFDYRAPQNKLIGREADQESSFEAIMFSPDTKTFLLVRETVPDGEDDLYRPSVVEARIGLSDYETIQECPVDYDFDAANKGFEGGAYFNVGGERYLLGLCEGNNCKGGAKGQEIGNGMAILTHYTTNKAGKCIWEFVKKVPLPAKAGFLDYADMAVFQTDLNPVAGVFPVAVVSQEDSAVWVGEIDTNKWEFLGPGEVYHFPRSRDCQTVYCNVEGISFIDRYQVIAISDRSKADQDYNCVERDQSVHIFLLPEPLKVAALPASFNYSLAEL